MPLIPDEGVLVVGVEGVEAVDVARGTTVTKNEIKGNELFVLNYRMLKSSVQYLLPAREHLEHQTAKQVKLEEDFNLKKQNYYSNWRTFCELYQNTPTILKLSIGNCFTCRG